MGEKHSSSGDLTTEGICVFENVQLYSITYMYYCNTEDNCRGEVWNMFEDELLKLVNKKQNIRC